MDSGHHQIPQILACGIGGIFSTCSSHNPQACVIKFVVDKVSVIRRKKINRYLLHANKRGRPFALGMPTSLSGCCYEGERGKGVGLLRSDGDGLRGPPQRRVPARVPGPRTEDRGELTVTAALPPLFLQRRFIFGFLSSRGVEGHAQTSSSMGRCWSRLRSMAACSRFLLLASNGDGSNRLVGAAAARTSTPTYEPLLKLTLAP